jgi:phenylpropionate dioxygenase-like ring-hydroxylating dioxygenase large terminal subunit
MASYPDSEARAPKELPLDLEQEWLGVQRRLVDHLRTGRLTDLEADSLEISAEVYTDPLRFEAERRKLFREEPLLVGFSGELSQPGERLIFDAAGPPIVVIRGEDGDLRAFLNMCPHRGSRLLMNCERERLLSCPFHGWVFDLEGQLRNVPLEPAFEGLDRSRRRLVPVPVSEWGGMIFVRARPGEDEIDVESFLGPIAPLLVALDLGALARVASDELPVASNWKFALDTFCEVYHLPAVHRDSLSLNLYPNVAVFDHYGLHHRYSGAGRDFEEFLDRPESEWPRMSYQAVHYVFPNTTFAFTHSLDGKTPVVSMFRLFPGESVGEAVTLAATYKRPDEAGVSDEAAIRMHQEVLEIVVGEDYRVAREGWLSLVEAPPGFRFVFGRNESLLQRYHRDLAGKIGMPIGGDSHPAIR